MVNGIIKAEYKQMLAWGQAIKYLISVDHKVTKDAIRCWKEEENCQPSSAFSSIKSKFPRDNTVWRPQWSLRHFGSSQLLKSLTMRIQREDPLCIHCLPLSGSRGYSSPSKKKSLLNKTKIIGRKLLEIRTQAVGLVVIMPIKHMWGPAFGLQHLQKCLGIVACTWNPSTGKSEREGSQEAHWPAKPSVSGLHVQW